jgi:uridylate kinase
LISVLGKHAFQDVIKSVEELEKVPENKIIVGAGIDFPGHSTDFGSAIFAEATRADLLIKATNIDGVYTSDPTQDPNAKKLEKVSYEEFEKILLKNKQGPGEYKLFDLSAAKIIARSKIKTIIVNGEDPEEILRAVEGKHKGSEILSLTSK